MRSHFQPYIPEGIQKSDAYAPQPEKILNAISTLFPAFWSLFFTYKHERGVKDHAAYEYAKGVLASLREPLPGTDIEERELERLRKEYSDTVAYFASVLIARGNLHLLEENAVNTARSRLHAIFVQGYYKYKGQRDREIQQKNPRKQKPSDRPAIELRSNPTIVMLEEVGVIESFNALELVERTKVRMDRIFWKKRERPFMLS
jgi:hypothetical protein